MRKQGRGAPVFTPISPDEGHHEYVDEKPPDKGMMWCSVLWPAMAARTPTSDSDCCLGDRSSLDSGCLPYHHKISYNISTTFFDILNAAQYREDIVLILLGVFRAGFRRCGSD
ncbi:hypothetical protein AVEN_98135-1 [Araneus ventricosus]|uniref:Uncharacterized protein n=1 Tax=Araneus ventricosus TaxID=182803 RepID=A0A4Y2P7T1_ARAVE|nr:hypothetical protein AVEN_98135-1 [Araneus ventricosus]